MTSEVIRELIAERYTLTAISHSTGGPSRYYQLGDTATRIGFISPHSHNFCSSCNRVRLTAEGRFLLCLGNEHSRDLRELVRDPSVDDEALQQAIVEAMDLKPEKHEFNLEEEPQIVRFMNMTGG
jgi:cyclic pyranopterin phosphate synthase